MIPVPAEMTDDDQYPELSPDDLQRYVKKYTFSQEQIKQMLEAFSVFDRDRDGLISNDELGSVLYAMGQRPTFLELNALIQGVDTRNSGTVNFDEFLQLMNGNSNVHPETELQEVFSVFDLNSDGVITSDELHSVLNKLGDTVSKAEVEEMIKEADINKDGVVDFSEFKGILGPDK